MRSAFPTPELIRPDPATATRMRAALLAAGFTGSLPLQRAEVRENDLSGYRPEGKQLAVAIRRTSAGEPVDVLTRLFLIGLPVPAAVAESALPSTGLAPWLDCGLLVRDGENVRATGQLAPVHGLYLASDAMWHGERESLHVLGYSGSTDTLAKATIRRRVGRMLDLGAGSGWQAFQAAAHAEEIVATDTNPRCLAYLRFNAALNGFSHVHARQGDLFAPVAGERFDLIVSNPPFVISPDRAYAYRDSGRPGDSLLRELLAAAPQHLNPGGFCQFMCEWAERTGEDGEAKIAGWVAGSGCDVLVLRIRRAEPADHAEMWANLLPGEKPAAGAARMARWIEWYAAERIERLCVGLFVLRKRVAGSPWLRFDDAPRLVDAAGSAIERRFAIEDFLDSHPGNRLHSVRLKVADGILWEQQLASTPTGWQVTDAQLRVKSGLAFMGTPNEFVIALMDRCRGERSLSEVFDDLEAFGQVDRTGATEVVRRLLEQGFLVPAADSLAG